jgi:hypothetical protein
MAAEVNENFLVKKTLVFDIWKLMLAEHVFNENRLGQSWSTPGSDRWTTSGRGLVVPDIYGTCRIVALIGDQ